MSVTDLREQEFKEDNPKVIYPDKSLIQIDEDSGIIFAQPIPDGTIDDSVSQVRHTPAAQRTDATAAIGDSKPASLRHAEVGLAELDTLADIFEGQTPELDETWEKEEIISLDGSELASDSVNSLSFDDQSDFSDLIGDLDSWETSAAESKVVGTQETSASTGENFIDWLGEDFPEEVTLDSQDATDDFSDLLFEAESPESLTAETGSTKNLSSLFGDTSEILGDGEDENNYLDIDNSSQELDNLGGTESQGDEAALIGSESDFSDLLAIAANHQEDLEFGEELMIDGKANDLDLAELELDESLGDLNLANDEDLDFSQLESDQEIFALEEQATAKALEPKENSQALDLEGLFGESTPAELEEEELDWQEDWFSSETSITTEGLEALTTTTAEADELASLLGEEMPAEEQELDWQADLFGTEASVPTQEVETLPQMTTEADELASLLGEEMPAEEQELDWQADLFGTEASVPTQEVETLPQMTTEADELASLLGEEMPAEEQELDWQADLFGSETSITTEGLEALTTTTAEADELASLLGEEMPAEEQELDWQADLFGTEASVPTQEVETLPQMTTEADELASLLGEEMPAEEQELDWQADLFGTEASVPTQEVETLPQMTTEADELASLLGEEMPAEEQELDWQADLFGTEASVPTQEVETLPQMTTEADELASLLGEEMPAEEQELDWQADLFGTEASVPTQEVETLPQMTTEAEELASLLGEEMPAETEILAFSEEEVSEAEMDSGWELELTDEQGIDDLLEEEPTEALEPEDIQEFLRAEADEVSEANTVTVPAVASEFDELEIMLEEAPLTTPSTVAEFDELEAMLEEEASLTTMTSTVAVFDELEAMLEEEPLPAMATNTPFVATATSSDSTETDVFSDLENLLDEETPEAAEQSPELEESAAKADEDDEFGDLEKLLEQADKTMGGQPTLKADQRQTKPQSRPRPRMFEQTMRVPIKRLDDLSNLVGELVVNRNSLEQDQERLRQFLDNLNHQVLSLNDVGARMQDLYERSLLESSLLASRHNYRSFFGGEQSSESSHANGAEYDPLEMDRFTGFHTLSQEMIELIVRVRESASDIVFLADGTDQVARTLRQITTQLQEGLTRARMVPFAQTADRLPRAVRDISLKLGKQAELQVEGRETLIDKMIIEHLNAPMTHLVNNAITHGIEPPEVRQAANKPNVGKITVRAFYQGNQAVISISDDGAGINPERVRNKIIERRNSSPQMRRKS